MELTLSIYNFNYVFISIYQQNFNYVFISIFIEKSKHFLIEFTIYMYRSPTR